MTTGIEQKSQYILSWSLYQQAHTTHTISHRKYHLFCIHGSSGQRNNSIEKIILFQLCLFWKKSSHLQTFPNAWNWVRRTYTHTHTNTRIPSKFYHYTIANLSTKKQIQRETMQLPPSQRVGQWQIKEITQSCPSLCDPVDCSPPGSFVHEMSQARILEWGAIPFFRGPSWFRDWTWVSCIADRHSLYCLSHQWQSWD